MFKYTKKGASYDYATTQFNLPKDLADKIIQFGKDNISDDCLVFDDEGSKGREDDCHITVLYGLETDKPTEIINALKQENLLDKPITVTLGKISKFENDEDVIKVSIENYEELEKLWKFMYQNFENISDYDTYIPHITIAYVESGSCDDIIGDDTFNGMKVNLTDFKFRGANGETKIVKLSMKKQSQNKEHIKEDLSRFDKIKNMSNEIEDESEELKKDDEKLLKQINSKLDGYLQNLYI